jgi:hypothetical protein
MWILQSTEVDSVFGECEKYLHTGIIHSMQIKMQNKFGMRLDNTLNLVIINMFVIIMITAKY